MLYQVICITKKRNKNVGFDRQWNYPIMAALQISKGIPSNTVTDIRYPDNPAQTRLILMCPVKRILYQFSYWTAKGIPFFCQTLFYMGVAVRITPCCFCPLSKKSKRNLHLKIINVSELFVAEPL